MTPPYKPAAIHIDNDDEEDGFYSIGFFFNPESDNAPKHLGLCRDIEENPDEVYIEADDQIYGFHTQSASFEMHGTVLTISLADDNRFYWSDLATVDIDIPQEDINSILSCLRSIFDIQVQ